MDNIQIDVREEPPRKFKPFIHLNRKIYFLGLTPMQVIVVVMVAALVALSINVLLGVFTFLPVYLITRNMRKEVKKGNPSYLQGKSVFRLEKKYVEDRQKILKYLKYDDS